MLSSFTVPADKFAGGAPHHNQQRGVENQEADPHAAPYEQVDAGDPWLDRIHVVIGLVRAEDAAGIGRLQGNIDLEEARVIALAQVFRLLQVADVRRDLPAQGQLQVVREGKLFTDQVALI